MPVVSDSGTGTPEQTVLPLPRSTERKHPACCHTLSSDCIYHRSETVTGGFAMLCAFTPLADTVEKQNKTFIVFKKGANLLLF